jgi:hypothetical protein
MANLKEVADAMFYKRHVWDKISDEDKEINFFIFNRYFSKKYPERSFLFNNKNIDKVSSMNIWYAFMGGKTYPKWFWSKNIPNGNKEKVSKKDFELLIIKLRIKEVDLKYLIENHYEFVKEELTHWKKLEKQN